MQFVLPALGPSQKGLPALSSLFAILFSALFSRNPSRRLACVRRSLFARIRVPATAFQSQSFREKSLAAISKLFLRGFASRFTEIPSCRLLRLQTIGYVER